MATGESEAGDLVPVRLLDMPVALWAKLDGEWKDLMREFALISLAEEEGEPSVPARLLELVHKLEDRYGTLGEEQVHVLESAHAAGRPTIAQLDYLLPRDVAGAIGELSAMMDETDAYCASGEYLLSLASSPTSKAFRDWIFTEFVLQLAGEGPTSWPESRFAAGIEEMAPE